MKVLSYVAIMIVAAGVGVASEVIIDLGEHRASGFMLFHRRMTTSIQFMIPDHVASVDSVYVSVRGVMPLGIYECYEDDGSYRTGSCGLEIFAIFREYEDALQYSEYYGVKVPAYGVYDESCKVMSVYYNGIYFMESELAEGVLDQLLGGEQVIDIIVCGRGALYWSSAECFPCIAEDNGVDFECSLLVYGALRVGNESWTWSKVKALYR